MNTNEFRAAVEAVLGRPLEDDTALVETSFGSLRVTLKPDAPAILLRFATPGEPWEAEALRAGINPQSGGWDVIPGRGYGELEDMPEELRKRCVRIFAARLACVGYVPPLDAPMDLTLPADALLAAVRGTGLATWFYAKSPSIVFRFGREQDRDWWVSLFPESRGICEAPEDLTGFITGVADAPEGFGPAEWRVSRPRLNPMKSSHVPPAGLPALPLTPEEKRLLTELLTNAVEIPVAYPAGGHMAALVGKTQDTFRGLLEKLQNL